MPGKGKDTPRLELDRVEAVVARTARDGIKAALDNPSPPLCNELWQIGSLLRKKGMKDEIKAREPFLIREDVPEKQPSSAITGNKSQLKKPGSSWKAAGTDQSLAIKIPAVTCGP
ncbi:hypothetical protein EYF80_000052 [Liparis tanakae]|uniref:Uncharacterized protein n=1 Tax=Liparis tanakae TaxID=230148 RepID=A0A4Z2JGN2_9TELE|nr:hypothetical protein EYF80_000052 [Liparis tanakae]